MPTIEQYRNALSQATAKGDEQAAGYFRSQVKSAGASTYIDESGSSTEGSIIDPLVQGASLGFADEIGGGLHGAYNWATGGEFSEGYDSTTNLMRERAKNYGERHPYISTAAEIGGGLAMPLGALRGGANAFRTALKSGAAYGVGTAEGPEGGDMEDSISERLKGALTGAAAGGLGYGVLKGGGKLMKGVFGRGSAKSRLPSHTKDVKALKQAGIKVSAPEELADMNTRQSYEALRRVFHNEDTRPQKLYEKLMKHAAGPGYGFTPRDIKIGDLSRDAVESAKRRYSKAYDDVFANTSLDPRAWWRKFLAVESKFDDLLPHERGAAKQIVTDFQDMISDMKVLTGRDYKRIRSGLTDKANKARSNPQYQGLSDIFRGLRDTLDEGFRSVAPADKVKRLKALDSSYGAFKQLSKAADNPEGIGTFVNAVRRDSHRLPKEFVRLATAYQNVILRGYPRSSMTPEGMAFGDLLRTGQHALRASTAPISRSYEKARKQIVPGPGQKAPRQRALNAQLAKLIGAAPKGALPFAVGQQAEDSVFSALPQALIEGR
jgi:hypothetical protein